MTLSALDPSSGVMDFGNSAVNFVECAKLGGGIVVTVRSGDGFVADNEDFVADNEEMLDE